MPKIWGIAPWQEEVIDGSNTRSVMDQYKAEEESKPKSKEYVNKEKAFEGAGLPTLDLGVIELGISDFVGPGALVKVGAALGKILGGGIAGFGILKGSKATTWDAKKALKASEMLEEGALPVDVWRKTGTFRSPGDSFLRQEIPDNTSRLLGDIHKSSRRKLDEVLYHPELFKAYPELRNIEVVTGPKIKNGSYSPSYKGSPATIGLGTNDTLFPIERLLHEVQHAVQNIERFQPGANEFIVKTLPAYKEAADRIYHKAGEKSFPGWTSIESSDLDTTLKLLVNSIYRRTAGEAEARAVAARTFESNSTLKKIIPTASYDIPLKDIIKQ